MKTLLTALLVASAITMFAFPTVSGLVGPAYAWDEEPDDEEKDQHANNGWGNGDQDAPGNSEFSNGAENIGGNADNTGDAPGNSGHDE